MVVCFYEIEKVMKIVKMLITGDQAKLKYMSARSRQKVKTQFNCQAIAKKVMKALSAK